MALHCVQSIALQWDYDVQEAMAQGAGMADWQGIEQSYGLLPPTGSEVKGPNGFD